MSVNLVHGIETRGRGPGHEQVAVRTEGQVIGRDAGLDRGEDKNLTVFADLENRAAAIAYIKILGGIEGDPRRNSHALGVGGHGSVRRDPVHRAVEARGYVHLPGAVEGDGRGIGHLRKKRLHVVIGVNFVDGHGYLLPARSREGDENIALGIERRIGYRMQDSRQSGPQP